MTTASLLARLFAALLVAPQRIPSDTTIVALTHVNVIDLASGAVSRDQTIQISGDRVTGVAPSPGLTLPKRARVIDAIGMFLIPGLWDMHVHVGAFGRAGLQLFLLNGVTGVRDLGGVPDTVFTWARETASGALLGPRIVAAGRTLDREAAVNPPHIVAVLTAAEAVAAVRANALAGAAVIKVWSMIPREAFLAAADEARRLGLPLVGHVPIQVGLVTAVEAGQRDIEHTISIPIALSRNETSILAALRARLEPTRDLGNVFAALISADLDALASPDEAAAPRVFGLLAQKRVWVCPTLTDSRAYTILRDSLEADPRFRYFSPSLRDQWVAEAKAMSDSDLAGLKRLFPAALRLVGQLHRAGVPLLAGTDAGSIYDFPGFDLHTELALMVRAGLTPLQALQTATRNPAAALGMAGRLGSIGPGKLADLVLLDANPLENIRNTTRIAGVVAAGRYLDRAALERIRRLGQ